jgi:hypothetical protein
MDVPQRLIIAGLPNISLVPAPTIFGRLR